MLATSRGVGAAAVRSILAGTTACSQRFRHRSARTRHTLIPPASGSIAVDLVNRDRLRSETLQDYHHRAPRHPVTTFGAGTIIERPERNPISALRSFVRIP